MKELKISQLMDDYIDNEVCIEGETWVDNEELKSLVMEQVKPRRKMKPLFKVMIAAAVAAACVTGATVGAIALGSGFTTADGASINTGTAYYGPYVEYADEDEDTVTLENGRLYLNLEDERIDITDKIDRKTPYIYSYTISGTGKPGYVIAGGTVDEYAYVTLAYIEDLGWFGFGSINGDVRNFGSADVFKDPEDSDKQRFYVTYGQYPSYDEEGNEEGKEFSTHHSHYNYIMGKGFVSFEDCDCPDAWLLNALEQIGLLTPEDYDEFDKSKDGYYQWLAHENGEFVVTAASEEVTETSEETVDEIAEEVVEETAEETFEETIEEIPEEIETPEQ